MQATLAEAEAAKSKGNAAFQREEYKEAIKQYTLVSTLRIGNRCPTLRPLLFISLIWIFCNHNFLITCNDGCSQPRAARMR